MARLITLGALGALLSLSAAAAAAEPPECLSTNPGDWPDPAKPYFLLAVDTSGSMLACTNPSGAAYEFPNSCPSSAPKNSCGMEPTRINDAKCALRNTVQTFAGEVNFGLLSFPVKMSSCGGGACVDSCTGTTGACNPPNALGTEGEFYQGNGCTVSAYANPTPSETCGNQPDCGGSAVPPPPNLQANWRNGGNVLVPLLPDPTWGASPPASNVPELLTWFDGQCDQSKELFALGATPLEGILRTAQEYLTTGWNTNWTDGTYCNVNPLPLTYTTPINTLDRPCRSLNIILVTDGDETCFGSPSSAASALLAGVTSGGKTYNVKTYVIGFAGATQALVDQIALAGGTQSALSANNEAQLSQALANIISGATKPEICNNGDDNCNGCTDEGYAKWCNTRSDCCQWTTTAQRQSCINVYLNSGNPADLPCTTPTQKTDPATWLCYQPEEQCNSQDDDCDGTIDEGFKKCGNPQHCPIAETCNNTDDDCDAIVDNAAGSGVPYSVCPNQCTPSQEICDGCDNDCDGVADDGIPPLPCGFSPPANCAGTKTCSPKPVPAPGGCVTNSYGPCNTNPQPEVCDTFDNDCDGVINNGVNPTPCEVPGSPGLVYKDTFAASQCVKGQLPCNGTCSGYIGPSTEVCDGIDNDCDGTVDDNVTGLGVACGTTTGPCTTGTTACIGGAIVCTGGVQPQPEVCNGIDDDCDGTPDDSPTDAPPAGSDACWNLPPTGCSPVCTFKNYSWCPPPGGTCGGLGTLTLPCLPGKLSCNGALGWTCKGGELPATEVCDSVDNDCDGLLNDGLGSPVGDSCGTDIGACEFGTKICNAGKIECSGGVGPKPEVCNGIDDNCEGTIDDGVSTGGTCWQPYNTSDYPGDRTKGTCIPGVQLCPANGVPQCVGGKGPQPEVCDGKDNDCDGEVDEITGTGPDSINGTSDPQDPTKVLGQPCGTDVGECTQGAWACENGQFACLGGKSPQPEACDCLDNDCDGSIDEEGTDADGGVTDPICAPGKACVKAAGVCQCALPCKSGEFPCSPPTVCTQVVLSSNGQTPPGGPSYCIDVGACKDCEKQTVTENGVVKCAPEGTTPGVPVCVCKGAQVGCQSPCYGVTCSSGLGCVEQGPLVGSCQPLDNCNYFPCSSGLACHDSKCIDDPCDPNPCPADQVCKPADSTLATHKCVGSCAGVTCGSTEKCVDGKCVPTGCAQPCPPGEVCHPATDGGAAFCWPSNCGTDGGTVCTQGQYCDPVTGECGDDPCTAVHCPSGQVCQAGECYWAPEAGTDGGAGSGGSGATDGGGGSGATDGGTKTEEPSGVWKLATGGGCACRAAGERSSDAGWLAGLALAAATALRRRRRVEVVSDTTPSGRGGAR